MDKIPGKRLVEKAEKTGNEIPVPMTRRRLGLAELLKRTAKEIQEDHLAAFAGNLTYKGLFALFPFFVFLLSLLGLFGAPDPPNPHRASEGRAAARGDRLPREPTPRYSWQ